MREHEGERGLKPGHAEGRQLELAILLPVGVGRMIGDDGVDGAVREALDERGGILGGAQRRVHLQRGLVLGGDGVLGEEHVVRRHLTGHRQALGLGGGHQIEPALGGDVLDVQRAPGQAAERDVAGDFQLLALGRPAHHA